MTDYRSRVIGLEQVSTKELRANPANFRRHPQAQGDALRGVLEQVGIAGALLAYRSERAGGALTLIDGHLRKDAAPQTWPVLVLDVTDAEADLLLATHDPIAAMAQSDAAALDALLKNVSTDSAAVQNMLAKLAEGAGLYLGDGEQDDSYSRNIEAPIYTPKGPKPTAAELYDDSRTRELLAAIEAADLPADEKEFLRVAARRHTVINYKRVAEYYAHSAEDVQTLMEDSALVIIDFGRAIELGYVKLAEAIAKQYGVDYAAAG